MNLDRGGDDIKTPEEIKRRIEMGLYIPYAEMPKGCSWRKRKGEALHICFYYDFCHVITKKYNERSKFCPIIEVSERDGSIKN